MSEANEQNIPNAQKRKLVIAGSAAVVVVLAIVATLALTGGDDKSTKPGTAAGSDIVPAPAVPPGLQTVVYDKFQSGFPADPEQSKTTGITEGVHPLKTVALYDAVGGKARSMAAPTIATNVDLVMPVVDKKSGWVAVLVPSANRQVAWIPDQVGTLEHRPLNDHIVVYRKQHKLVWLKNDKPQREWEVSLGAPNTPTPLGRSYVLGRSALVGSVYAGEDVLALSSVPDDPTSVNPGLRGAHTGIHTWHTDANLGRDVTDGCIRLTKSGHQLLLREIEPGTPVTVLP